MSSLATDRVAFATVAYWNMAGGIISGLAGAPSRPPERAGLADWAF